MTREEYIDGAEKMRETLVWGLALANKMHAISTSNIGDEPDYHATACIQAFDIGWDIRRCLTNIEILIERMQEEAGL